MKLKKFIKELENILENAENPEKIEVQMADCASVVKPFFKDNIVFITDVEDEEWFYSLFKN